MKRIFADTSGFVALFYDKDKNHALAVHILKQLKETNTVMLTTDYILDECITGIMSNVGHKAAVRAGEYVFNSNIIDIVWLDQSLKMRAWDYFKRHDDKRFSFTDCTSFVLMDELKIKRYFAFDEDFKRAGFISVS